MAKSNYISMPVIRRLPRYYRHLTTLKTEESTEFPQKNCLKIWVLLPLKSVRI